MWVLIIVLQLDIGAAVVTKPEEALFTPVFNTLEECERIGDLVSGLPEYDRHLCVNINEQA